MFPYFIVKDQSMEPFCREGNFVLINRMSYLFSCPRVGQIVVLEDPRDSSRLVLKRITRAKQGTRLYPAKDSFFWVEGDNKEKSIDSRHFGWVEKRFILGKALIIGKPPRLKNECGVPTLLPKSSGGSYPQDKFVGS